MATVGLLLIAWDTARTAIKTLRETEESNRRAHQAAAQASVQAQEDSIRRTRPYVFAELVPSIAGVATYDMVIRNVGRSVARGLTVTLDAVPEHLDDIASKVLDDLRQERDLPPGASLRTYWQLGVAEGQHFTDGKGNLTTEPAGLPRAGALRLSYTSDDTSQPQYSERYGFDADRAGLWPVPEYSDEPKTMDDTGKALHGALAAIARHIGMLRW